MHVYGLCVRVRGKGFDGFVHTVKYSKIQNMGNNRYSRFQDK